MSNDIGHDGLIFEDGLPFFIDHDLQVDDSGMLIIQSTIEAGLEKAVVRKPFYEITEFMTDDTDLTYGELYSVAHALQQEAEKLRELAVLKEDSEQNVADLFDTDYDPTA
jgi:hypothetical protein